MRALHAPMKFTGDEFRLRDISCRAIVKLVCLQPGQTRASLAQALALPKSSVISLVRQLLHDGWLQELDCCVSSGLRGRRAALLHLRPDRLCLLGVALDGDGMCAVATTLTGEVLAEAGCQPGNARETGASLDAMARLLCQLHQQVQAPDRRVVAIGIDVPGQVHDGGGGLVDAQPLAWQRVPAARLLKERLRGLPLQDVPLHLRGQAQPAGPMQGSFSHATLARCPARLAPAVDAAGFARHRMLHPLKPPSRLPALVARYGHRYSAPVLHEALGKA